MGCKGWFETDDIPISLTTDTCNNEQVSTF